MDPDDQMINGLGKDKCQLLESAIDTEGEYQCLLKTKVVE
jgi:hypothetical protein